jgi:Flp pilus assembly protein TadB
MARRIAAAVLAAAALVLAAVLWLVAERQAGDSADRLRRILAADAVNLQEADTAAKQAVVNGFTARDLLVLQSEQAADTQRLLGLLGVVIGLGAAAIVIGLLLIPARRAPLPPPSPPPEPPGPDEGRASIS